MTEEQFAEKLCKAGLPDIPRADIVATLPAARKLAEQAQHVRQAAADRDD